MGTGVVAMGFKLVGGPISFVIWSALLSASVIWTGFVLWRAGRMMQAASIKGDRQYDQHGKYLLPPEYARSESATAARRRGKKR
ncbi:MAG: hypothetical protein EBR82_04785 [Caulobacteraceae bacterium]|nr:hypothetical protein [Caulobacteraceae bacterium]